MRLTGAAPITALTLLLVGCAGVQPSTQPLRPGITAAPTPDPSTSGTPDTRTGTGTSAGTDHPQHPSASSLSCASSETSIDSRFTTRPSW